MSHGSTLRLPLTPNIQGKRGTWHLEGRLCVNALRSGAWVYTEVCASKLCGGPARVQQRGWGVHLERGGLFHCYCLAEGLVRS